MKGLLFFLLIAHSVVAQIEFKPVFYSPCEDSFFVAQENNRRHAIHYLSGLPSQIADTGLYTFKMGIHSESYTIKVEEGGFHDTINLQQLHMMFVIGQGAEYLVCNSKANGYYKETYYNGQPKFIGTFEDGQIKDSLIEYYPNGVVKSAEYIKPFKYFKYTYYMDGQLKTYMDNEFERTYYPDGTLQYEYDFYQRTEKKYFSNGNLSSIETSKEQKTYYTHQQLKSRIVKDVPNGAFMRMGLVRFKFSDFSNYKWQVFDSISEKMFEVHFELSSSHFSGRFPETLISLNDAIVDKAFITINHKKKYKLKRKPRSVSFELYEKVNGKWRLVKEYDSFSDRTVTYMLHECMGLNQ